MRFYHNTVLRRTPVFRDSLPVRPGRRRGCGNTERDVFNNIFVQTERVPGVSFVGMKQAENLREGGNLLWGLNEGPTLKARPVRQVPLVALVRPRAASGTRRAGRRTIASPTRNSSASRPTDQPRRTCASNPIVLPSTGAYPSRPHGPTPFALPIKIGLTWALCRREPNRGAWGSMAECRFLARRPAGGVVKKTVGEWR